MNIDLSKILAGAKSLMDAEDSGMLPTKREEKGRVQQMQESQQLLPPTHPSGLRVAEGASKLPPAIRESILSNPTPSEAEMRMLLDPVAMAHQKMLEEQQSLSITNQGKTINVSNNSDLILVSKTELRAMMLETLIEFMPKITSNIEENAIKKTIQCVIKENKQKKERL